MVGQKCFLVSFVIFPLLASALSCSAPELSEEQSAPFAPTEVIDLGTLVTEDLPERFWGPAFLNQMGFTSPNTFDVIDWNFPMEGGTVSGSNSYYRLFNHGGPHIDAPNHFGAGDGVDSYPIEAFSGPVKLFDVRGNPSGRSVDVDVFEGAVEVGDVVLVLTGYTPPSTADAFPDSITLTHDAAELLATLPVRAYATDAFGVESLSDRRMPSIHHSLLSRGIPVYEQLVNMDSLVGKQRMYFVGVPLNIAGGDGMIVRPVVFVY